MKKILLPFVFALCALIFFGCTKDHTEEIENWTQPKLAGTQWKLAGIMNSQTGMLTELAPKGCEQCYTLTFDSDTTGTGYSASNRLKIALNKKVSIWTTLSEMAEVNDGDLLVDASHSISSYELKDGELKFFYEQKGKKYYLLYKQSDNKTVTYPLDIATTEYALPVGSSWNYTSMDPGVYIINSQEALQKVLSYNATPPSGIDFDRYSLLFAFGQTTSNILQQSSRLVQISIDKFQLDVYVALSTATVAEFWTVAVLIPKIPLCSMVQLNENQYNNGDGNIITVAKGELQLEGDNEGFARQGWVITAQRFWEYTKEHIKHKNPVFDYFDESEFDFSTFQIIGVFDRIHTNGDCSIDITDIMEYPDSIVVTVQNLNKGNAIPALTQPFHIVKIPVSNKKIVFKKEGLDEIPITEYSLKETPCEWFKFSPNIEQELIIINSKEELGKCILCTGGGDFPAVDFSKYTLLLAFGQPRTGIMQEAPPILFIDPLTGNYTLNITTYMTAIQISEIWFYPILISKIPVESVVTLKVLLAYRSYPPSYYYF